MTRALNEGNDVGISGCNLVAARTAIPKPDAEEIGVNGQVYIWQREGASNRDSIVCPPGRLLGERHRHLLCGNDGICPPASALLAQVSRQTTPNSGKRRPTGIMSRVCAWVLRTNHAC